MTLSLVAGEAAWRSRNVQYYTGDWTSIQTVLPEFELTVLARSPPRGCLALSQRADRRRH